MNQIAKERIPAAQYDDIGGHRLYCTVLLVIYCRSLHCSIIHLLFCKTGFSIVYGSGFGLGLGVRLSHQPSFLVAAQLSVQRACSAHRLSSERVLSFRRSRSPTGQLAELHDHRKTHKQAIITVCCHNIAEQGWSRCVRCRLWILILYRKANVDI